MSSIVKLVQDVSLWIEPRYEITNDDKKAAKILDLVTAVMSDPFTGIGKPEALKYMKGNFWSRRIDLEHRLVYVVNNEQIVFFACRYHYEELSPI